MTERVMFLTNVYKNINSINRHKLKLTEPMMGKSVIVEPKKSISLSSFKSNSTDLLVQKCIRIHLLTE